MINVDKVFLILFLILFFISTVLSMLLVYTIGYQDGQTDAISGKVVYELKQQPNGETKWVMKK